MNSLTWCMWGLLIIAIMAVISNTGTTSQSNVSHQIFVMTCHLPVQNAIDHLYFDSQGNFIGYENFTYPNNGNGFGTYYECTSAGSQVNSPNELITVIKGYNQTVVNFPSGWFVYLSDTMTVLSGKASAVVNIILFILTPINLHVLGYGITDIGGVGLMFVIGLYTFAYVGIALEFGPRIATMIRGILPSG